MMEKFRPLLFKVLFFLSFAYVAIIVYFPSYHEIDYEDSVRRYLILNSIFIFVFTEMVRFSMKTFKNNIFENVVFYSYCLLFVFSILLFTREANNYNQYLNEITKLFPDRQAPAYYRIVVSDTFHPDNESEISGKYGGNALKWMDDKGGIKSRKDAYEPTSLKANDEKIGNSFSILLLFGFLTFTFIQEVVILSKKIKKINFRRVRKSHSTGSFPTKPIKNNQNEEVIFRGKTAVGLAKKLIGVNTEDIKLEIKRNRKTIKNENNKTRNQLSAEFEKIPNLFVQNMKETEKLLIDQSLKRIDDEIVQVKNSQKLIEMVKHLIELAKEKNPSQAELIKASNEMMSIQKPKDKIDIKHKLKITLPIIPTILKYERELSGDIFNDLKLRFKIGGLKSIFVNSD